MTAIEDELRRRLAAAQTLNDALEERIETLEERVLELENAGVSRMEVPPSFALTGKEAKLLAYMMKHEVCTKTSLHHELYSFDLDGGADPKIVDVFMCKIRKKLKTAEINIETVWGTGYRLPHSMKQKVLEMIEIETGRTAAVKAA